MVDNVTFKWNGDKCEVVEKDKELKIYDSVKPNDKKKSDDKKKPYAKERWWLTRKDSKGKISERWLVCMHMLKSQKTILGKEKQDRIIIFTQFYIPKNKERYKEIKETLRKNVENKFITNILLVNERRYTEKEMGIYHKKIIQIVQKKRMKFIDVFTYIKKWSNIKGYIIVANSDIIFDKSLKNLFRSKIHSKKKMYSLVRLEYDKNNINDYKVYRNMRSSTDTWIFHTNQLQYIKNITDFNIEIGTPGIDQLLPYLFYKNNFEIYNEPFFIRTFHNHHCERQSWVNQYNPVNMGKNLLSCWPNLENTHWFAPDK